MSSEDELATSATAGYKAGSKKTAAELAQMDAEDGNAKKIYTHRPQ
jgi:hypothetical protein